jgi:hypothetical protein
MNKEAYDTSWKNIDLVGIKRSDCLQDCIVWKAPKYSVRVLNMV